MAIAYRNSASFGKRQEFAAIAELLRHDFDVYLTLVDDQQIDCVGQNAGCYSINFTNYSQLRTR